MPRVYSELCSTCQYMKQNRAFAEAVILSTYFEPTGAESVRMVLKRYNDPVPYPTMLKHCQRHMKPNIHGWRRVNGLVEKAKTMKATERAKEIMLRDTLRVVEAEKPSVGAHEEALDSFIDAAREKLDMKAMPISAANFIQAIKVKAEIENKTKDRRFDALKTIFSGAAPKSEDKTL